MRIQELPSLFRNPDIRQPLATGEKARPPHNPEAKSADGDVLDVSLSSKISTLSEEASKTIGESEEGLTAERITEIRARIDAGFYASPVTLSATAEQLLDFYSR